MGIERALGPLRFRIAVLTVGHKLRQQEVARRVRKSQSTVSYHLAMVKAQYPDFIARRKGRTQLRPITTALADTLSTN